MLNVGLNIKKHIPRAANLDQVIKKAFNGQTLHLRDETTGFLLYGQPPEKYLVQLASKIKVNYHHNLGVGKKVWQVEVWPTSTYITHSESWLTWMVLVIGLMGTSIAVSSTLINSGRRQYLERAIAIPSELQEQLEAARHHLHFFTL